MTSVVKTRIYLAESEHPVTGERLMLATAFGLSSVAGVNIRSISHGVDGYASVTFFAKNTKAMKRFINIIKSYT